MPQEISSAVLKKDAQIMSAVPVCRSCAIAQTIPLEDLHACPGVRTCQIAKCENQISYMWIK